MFKPVILVLVFAFPSIAAAQIVPPGTGSGGGTFGGSIGSPIPDATLDQTDAMGNPIPLGGAVPGGTIFFECVAPKNNLTLHVEIKRNGIGYVEPFTGTTTASSPAVLQGQAAIVSFVIPDVIPFGAHWQAWWVTSAGVNSVKVAFGYNPESEPDFQAVSEGLFYRETFLDPGLPPGWNSWNSSPTVQWNVDGDPASVPGGSSMSAPYSLNYNDGTDYNDGNANSGTATSPVLDLTGSKNPILTFWCNYDTDTTGTITDQRVLSVQGAWLAIVWKQVQFSSNAGDCAEKGVWHQHSIPLDDDWGEIALSWSFDTVDSWNNDHAGWFIDDIEIREGEVDPGSGKTNPIPDDDEHREPSLSCWGSIAGGGMGGQLIFFLSGFTLLFAGRIRRA